MSDSFRNVSALLSENAQKHPDKIACVLASQKQISFKEMEKATCRNVALFLQAKVRSGDRVATFVRPGLDFVPVIFALFRIGAIPVFIDPGMTPQNMLKCVEQSRCRVMIGVPLALFLKKFRPRPFRHIETSLCLSKYKILPYLLNATHLPLAEKNKGALSQHIDETSPDQLAAILFTSGSTGVPKGVEVTFGILWEQQKTLKSTFQIQDDEMDMVPFPLFALFSAAWGVTSLIPDMNPAKPAQCDGKKLFELMLKHGVTHTAGSPAIWQNVLDYAKTHKKSLPQLKRILMAGAPVSEKLIRGWQEVLPPHGNVFTPYGATEALPLTFISDQELLTSCFSLTQKGLGSCVGKPLDGIEIKIIATSDDILPTIEDTTELPQGRIGEIIVKGKIVTQRYYGNTQATSLAKIKDNGPEGELWHRMGDLGYWDENGRLWFCGRKDHRIKLSEKDELYPAALEQIFNKVEGVARTALVGIHSTTKVKPILLVEGKESSSMRKTKEFLLNLAQEHEATKSIQTVLSVRKFPTDVRHNIKINRSLLAGTTARRLRHKAKEETK